MGSNTFFLAASYAYGFTSKAIYDGEELVGFASHGLDKKSSRYEMVSIIIGYQYQGRGYGVAVLQLGIDEMIQMYQCQEIYLSVIHDNERAIRVYEKLGFKPTGKVEQGQHPRTDLLLKGLILYFTSN